MRTYSSTTMSLRLTFAMILVVPTFALGQEDDPIELAKRIPPKYVQPGETVLRLAAIEWQLVQQRALKDTFSKSRDKILAESEQLQEDMSALQQAIPISIRFLDESVRSQLVGKAMEQLLDAQLEVATLEKTVAMLEQQLAESQGGKLARLRQRELALEVEGCQKRYMLAKGEYEKLKKMRDTGSISEQQLSRAEVSSEIALMEMESARVRAEIGEEEANVKAAERLANERLAIQPLKTRIETIEKFLESFQSSSDAMAKMESHKRNLELWQKDLHMIAMKIFDIGYKIEQLQALQSEMKKRIPADK